MIGSVSPATRQRVLDFLGTTNYRPNLAARNLASGRSGVVGVVMHVAAQLTFVDAYFTELLTGVCDSLTSQAASSRLCWWAIAGPIGTPPTWTWTTRRPPRRSPTDLVDTVRHDENQRNETMDELRRGGGAHDDHRCLRGSGGSGDTTTTSGDTGTTEDQGAGATSTTEDSGGSSEDKTTVRWFIGLGAGGQPEQEAAQRAVIEEFNSSQDEIELVIRFCE